MPSSLQVSRIALALVVYFNFIIATCNVKVPFELSRAMLGTNFQLLVYVIPLIYGVGAGLR